MFGVTAATAENLKRAWKEEEEERKKRAKREKR